ncbi:MAG: choice-of-anchor J domain-containing protein [Bacteroidales bacterium]|nr:choice-of-anchor J domain-containing protein [Bacteroidales bacterium]
MKRSVITVIAVILAGLAILITGCVKEIPDEPPYSTIPYDPEKVLTIAELKQIYIELGSAYTFTDDYSLFATVVMDESSGNIYESSFVQDKTGAIQLNFFYTSGLYLGDSIRVFLRGATVSDYHDLYQVQNLSAADNIYKIKTNNFIEPEVVTIDQIALAIDTYQSTPIKLDSVQFVESELGTTFADAVNLEDVNRMLEDCNGNTIIARTSGYANFAGDTLPKGKGSLIAIASVYNGEAQLVIRSINEVQLTGNRCGGGGGEPIDPVAEVNENFDSVQDYTDVNLTGWTNIKVAGDRRWQGKTYQSEKYAQSTGYNSGLSDMETWLITPPVINTNGDKELSFKTAMAFWAHSVNEPITVLASTDFDGTNFETATWTEISANLANAGSGDNNWVESGAVSLADFIGNVAIAFKYKGSDSESTSIRVDDVVINSGGGGGTTVFSENFDDSWGGWERISLLGAQVWDRDNNYGPDDSPCAEMTGFENGSHTNNDWLISPAMDLSTYSSATLTFETARNYDGNPIVVKISTDYDGMGNPNNATWTTLSATLSTGSFTWTESGNVNISAYTGQNVYMAFQYTSTNDMSATWRVDNIEVKAE